jgi:hypothetical protein
MLLTGAFGDPPASSSSTRNGSGLRCKIGQGQICRLSRKVGVHFTKAGAEKLGRCTEHNLRRALIREVPVASPWFGRAAASAFVERPRLSPLMSRNQFIDENGGAPVRLAKRGQGEGKAPCAARQLRTARVTLVLIAAVVVSLGCDARIRCLFREFDHCASGHRCTSKSWRA